MGTAVFIALKYIYSLVILVCLYYINFNLIIISHKSILYWKNGWVHQGLPRNHGSEVHCYEMLYRPRAICLKRKGHFFQYDFHGNYVILNSLDLIWFSLRATKYIGPHFIEYD